MSNPTRTDTGPETAVRAYARSLGLTDERAVAAALHRLQARAGRHPGPALDEACALLRSWARHPTHRAAAAA